MCIPVPRQKPQPSHPQAYRIHRLDNTNNGSHERRYSSVERHLNAAPPVQVGYRGKKYPHKYNNKDDPHPFPDGLSLYEYPTKQYPYYYQNSKGAVRDESPNGTQIPAEMKKHKDKGYTRTVTDRHKNIQGVIYHPHSSTGKPNNEFRRAEEIYPPPPTKGRWR